MPQTKLSPVANEILDQATARAAENAKTTLNAFYPAREEWGPGEQNMLFQWGHAFADGGKDRGFCIGVPCRDVESERWNCRMDAYAFTPEIGIFIECKQLWSIPRNVDGKYQALLADRKRLNSANVENALESFAGDDHKPAACFALLLVDCWEQEIVDWWKRGTGKYAKLWPRSPLLNGMRCDSITVAENWDDCSYFWLYAYRQLWTRT